MKKNIPEWKSIGDYQEFKSKAPRTKIDPRIDWFISSLLANYKQYELDDSTKSQLIFFVYLLLNNEFQSFLTRLRNLLSIPERGFTDSSEFHIWQSAFNQSAYNFRTRNPVDERFINVLQFLELKMGRLIRHIKSTTKTEDPDDELLHVLVKELRIDRPFYPQWLLFLKNVLFLPDPKQFLDNLAHQNKEERIIFEPLKITIVLTRKSTLNSIKTILNRNEAEIRKTIQGIKTRTKETALEVQNLDRDYAIYKSYISHSSTRKRGEDINENVRKEIHAMNEVEPLFNIEDMDFSSIRNITSKMKCRIQSTYSDKQSVFNAVIAEIEQLPTS